jgi:hypothetical protein
MESGQKRLSPSVSSALERNTMRDEADRKELRRCNDSGANK